MRKCIFIPVMFSILLCACSGTGADAAQSPHEQPISATNPETSDNFNAEFSKPAEGSVYETDKSTADIDVGSEYEQIVYSYQLHPFIVTNNDKDFALMWYSSIDSKNEFFDKYPALKLRIEEFNEEDKTDVLGRNRLNMSADATKKYDDEIEKYTFKNLHTLIPTRADSEAFSFVLFIEWYSGEMQSNLWWWAYNIDPVSGEDIELSDVITDMDALPEILIDKFNEINEKEKLTNHHDGHSPRTANQYFINEDRDFMAGEKVTVIPTGKDRLYNLENPSDGHTQVWALDYDGIWLFFSAAMESAAYGVKISYADHPEIFSDQWFPSYADGDISSQITKLPDAETQYMTLENYLH